MEAERAAAAGNLRLFFAPLMSALDHKRTFRGANVMSVLPSGHVQCVSRISAKGQKQTSREFVAMSANDSNPTSAGVQSVVSRDALDVLRQQFAGRQITEVA